MEFFLVVLAALLIGCRPAPAPAASALALTDDQGVQVTLAAPAQRIVSLVPSATETVVAIAGAERIVGRTRYDRDSTLAAAQDLGGGLDPNLEAIVALKPDLVIGMAGDARGDLRARLKAAGIPVLSLRLEDTTDAFRSIALLGRALGDSARAAAVADSVRADFAAVRAAVAGRARPRVFYVVFDDPPMTAGPRTFLGQLLDLAGAENVFADATTNWPTVAIEAIVARTPDIIILPTGELPTASLARLRAAPGWSSLAAVREGRVRFVDGDLMNRPGARMGLAARTLAAALEPAAK